MTNAMKLDSVIEEMDDRMDEWIDILTDFISIPSENPPGDTTEIASYLTDLFDERGIPYEVVAPQQEMPNVIGHFEGTADNPDEGPHLVYNGHLDTLHIGERGRWDRDPFSGDVEDGKIHGRGAADMYGGMIASLASFIYLFEHRDQFAGEVTYTAVSDEETGGEWGAKFLVDHHPDYHGDALISGEPSANNVIRFGERGTAWTKIQVAGEAAAASYQGGINAIETLCDFLDEVRRLPDIDALVNVPEDVRQTILSAREDFDESWGNGATDQVLQVTSSVGVIDGGKVGAVNVTPESASARVDIRLPVGTTGERVLELLRGQAGNYPGDITIEMFEGSNPTYSDTDHPLFQHLQQSATRARGGSEPSFGVSLAGTDCRYWREIGVPCAVYGPTPYNVGNQNEYIYVEDFEEVVKAQAGASVMFMNPD